MSDDVKVTLTLRKPVADKLRRLCHLKGETASEVIDRWVFEHHEDGSQVAQKGPMDRIVDAVRGMGR